MNCKQFLSSLCLLVFGSGLRGQDALIGLIRDGARASASSITTLYAQFDIEQEYIQPGSNTPPRLPAHTRVEWWQDGDRIHCKATNRSELTRDNHFPKENRIGGEEKAFRLLERECVVNNGEIKIINRNTEPGARQTVDVDIKPYYRDSVLPDDVWYHALVVLLAKPRSTLGQMLDDPRRVQEVLPFEMDDHKLYKLVIKAPPPLLDYTFQVIVDPRYNFLVKSYRPISTSPKVILRKEHEVLTFREFAPGIYFPEHVVSKTEMVQAETKKWHLAIVTTTRFRSVIINEPMEAKTFEVISPIGAAVIDHRNHTSYIAGEDGTPKGEVMPAPGGGVVVAEPTYLTEARNRPIWPLLVFVGLLLVVGGLFGAFLYKRVPNRLKP